MSLLWPRWQSTKERSQCLSLISATAIGSVYLGICLCVSSYLQQYGCDASSTLLICARLHCISNGEFWYAFFGQRLGLGFGIWRGFMALPLQLPPTHLPLLRRIIFIFILASRAPAAVAAAAAITTATSMLPTDGCCCCCCYIWHIADIDSMRRCNEICCARQRESRPSLNRPNNVAFCPRWN